MDFKDIKNIEQLIKISGEFDIDSNKNVPENITPEERDDLKRRFQELTNTPELKPTFDKFFAESTISRLSNLYQQAIELGEGGEQLAEGILGVINSIENKYNLA